MSVRIGLGQRIPSSKIRDQSYMRAQFARRPSESATASVAPPTMTHAQLRAHRAEEAKVSEVVVTMEVPVKVRKAKAKAPAVPAAKKPSKSKK